MPFNAQVEAMFLSFKNNYISSGGSLLKYNAFYDAVSDVPFLVNRFNDAQGQGTLTSINFSSSSPNSFYLPKQAVWDPRSRKYVGSTVSGTGVITFNAAALNGNEILENGQRNLTGAFLAAHEIAHAINAQATSQSYITALNSAATYINSQSQSTPVNVTAQVSNIIDAQFKDEARASFSAYNDLISSFAASGQPVTASDLQRLASSTDYARYFIDDSTGVLKTNVPVQLNGLISLSDVAIAAGVGLMRSTEPDTVNNHAVQYGIAALAFMCVQPSNAVLSVDAHAIGISNTTVSFSAALAAHIGDFQSNQATQCVIQDTSSGMQATINTSARGTPQVVVRDPLNPAGVSTSVIWGRPSSDGLSTESFSASVDEQGNIIEVNIVQDGVSINLTGVELGSASVQIAAIVASSTNAAPLLDYNDLTSLLTAGVNGDGGGVTSEIDRAILSAHFDSQGHLIISGHSSVLLSYDPRSKVARYGISAGQDSYGREISQEWDVNIANGSHQYTGITQTQDGDLTITRDVNGPTTIRLADSPIHLDFVDAAEILANTFGRYIAGDDILTQTLASATLRTIASNFGDVLNTLAFDGGTATTDNLSRAFDGLGQEFVNNLKSAGAGAVSSYLTAQLVDAIGIGGLPGELLTTEAGQVINTILNNAINGSYVFNGLSATSLANTAGSFVGTKLAEEIANWDEVGEQIGAQIGSAIGAAAGTAIPIPVIGTAIGAFFGDLIGGLIGGLFTGKPKSGAIVGYSSSTGQFAVQSVWKEDGGKKAVARQLGNSVATSLNGIIDTIGGELTNATAVEAGSYGMRAKSYIYWEDGTESDNRIKFASASDLVEYGVMRAAKEMQFLGGEIYEKRAFYNAIVSDIQTSIVEGDAVKVDFGLDNLVGNLSVAQQLRTYLNNSASINALIAAEPDSVFSAQWLLMLSQASDIGLLKRNTHDWDGGFSYLLKQGGIDARNVGFQFEALSREGNGERVMTLNGAVLQDNVDSGSKTVINGSTGDDVITASSGGIRDGAAQDSSYHISNVFHGGSGDDLIFAEASGDDLFGDDGNDTLVGGALDDWLFGGAGDDVLDAGGGNGNLLSGDAGNDILLGRAGSDWLLGGAGADQLFSDLGDDILEGGTGADTLDGGAGSDRYVFRVGDGTDQLSDSGSSQSDIDILEFGETIKAQDITIVARSSAEPITLFIDGPSSGDRVELSGLALGEFAGIEAIKISSETLNRGEILARTIYSKVAGVTVAEDAQAQNIVGTAYDDNIGGGAGADTLLGGFGSDTYHYNLGDGVDRILEQGFGSDIDILSLGTGISAQAVSVQFDPSNPFSLVLKIGQGGDEIILKDALRSSAENGIEEVRFADGSSWTIADIRARIPQPATSNLADSVAGSVMPDHLVAGGGNDTLAGGKGDDRPEGGAGDDTYIYNLGDGHDYVSDNAGTNRLVFGAGIDTADVGLARDYADPSKLRLTVAGTDGSILIEGQFASVPAGIEQIEFSDGTIWNRGDISDRANQDSLVPGNGVFNGTDAPDMVFGGAGNNLLFGYAGDDTLKGGGGSDYLEGGQGSDSYLYDINEGTYRIAELGYGYYDKLDQDRIVFGQGISSSDLRLSVDYFDPRNLTVRFAGSAGAILIDNQFTDDLTGVDIFQFDGGEIWDRTAIVAHLLDQSSTSGDDIIYGVTTANLLSGQAGNDKLYGLDGNDTLSGGTGSDTFDGGVGDDTYLYSVGDGDDRIIDPQYSPYRSSGYDVLQLGSGITASDLVLTRLYQNSTNLKIAFTGQSGSITIDNQFLDNVSGIDEIRFASGQVWSRADIVQHVLAQATSAGNDVVYGFGMSETLDGMSGNDAVVGSVAADTIIGGTGNDNLQGGDGSDTYIYNLGDGNDRIFEGVYSPYHDSGAADRLVFGSGITTSNIVLKRDIADDSDLIISFSGELGSIAIDDQFIDGVSGIDAFYFDDGTIWSPADILAAAQSPSLNLVTGTNLDLNLVGSAGGDRLVGGPGNDTLNGGLGDDVNLVGGGNNIVLFNLGDGKDVISRGVGLPSGTTILRFGAGIDPADLILTRRSGGGAGDIIISIAGTADEISLRGIIPVAIDFYDGTTWSSGQLAAAYLSQATTPSDDIITSFGAAGQLLSGGAGDDQLSGSGGGDTLSGGSGNDLLVGGGGNNTFIFNIGDGQDVIDASTDYFSDPGGGFDTIKFGAGISPSDLRIKPAGADDVYGVIIYFDGPTDQLYLRHVYAKNDYYYAQFQDEIEQYEFADGTIWTAAEFRTRYLEQQESASDDVIYGTDRSDYLRGGDGDDQLYGLLGTDTLEGGKGNDLLVGGGQSVLSGGDTYIFGLGDGQDTIDASGGNFYTSGGGGVDTLQFGEGISASNLRLSRHVGEDDYGVVISIAGTDDSVYLKFANGSAYYWNFQNTVEQIKFADGTIWSDLDLRNHLFDQEATSGNDLVFGSDADDRLNAKAGDDKLVGNKGNDTLDGGVGNDLLVGGEGTDTYLLNRFGGQDTVSGSTGAGIIQLGLGIGQEDVYFNWPYANDEQGGYVVKIKGLSDSLFITGPNGAQSYIQAINFADGSSWNSALISKLIWGTVIDGKHIPVTMGADQIFGTVGADTIEGLGGNDLLRGGMGSDVYRFSIGDGLDSIYDPVHDGDTDVLELQGITSSMVRVLTSFSDADDVIFYISDSDVIYLDQQKVGASGGIELVRFQGGETWSRADILARAQGQQSTAGNDLLVGTNFADTLTGGLGNDTVQGGSGADTYIYHVGDGDDVIVDDARSYGAVAATSADTLSFGAGITLQNLRLGRSVDDQDSLIITLDNSSGSLLLKGQNSGNGLGIEKLMFVDGSTASFTEFATLALAASSTSGNDEIVGYATDDDISGGLGNDHLDGRAGSDTYRFDLGNGHDVIEDTDRGLGADKLIFGSGITTGEVKLSRSLANPDDLTISIGASNSVTIIGQFDQSGTGGLDAVYFDNTTVWTRSDLLARYASQAATNDSDFIIGTGAAESFNALDGDDIVQAGAGDDTLIGAGGDDSLFGGAGNDSISGGNGNDVISGDTGVDTLDGGLGFDTVDYSFSLDSWFIDLGSENAHLASVQDASRDEAITGFEAALGGLGNDTIIGSSGNNRLMGNAGDDQLIGGAGDDVFLYDGDEGGVDEIQGGDGVDRIEALSDQTIIGIKSISGIETVSGNGYTDVIVGGSDGADDLDFSSVHFDGISRIELGDGADTILGSLDHDLISGGAGDDVIAYRVIESAADDIDGGDGFDIVAAAENNAVIAIRSLSGIEKLSAAGFTGVTVSTSDQADSLDLSQIAVEGIAGFNLKAGDDSFVGTAGADTVRGGIGSDTLSGGDGDDVFEYEAADTGRDEIHGGADNDAVKAVADNAIIGLKSFDGIETITGGGYSGVQLVLTDGADNVSFAGVTVQGISGILGGHGNDTLTGSSADDVFVVNGVEDGTDNINGGLGYDRIAAGADNTAIALSGFQSVEEITAAGHAGVSIVATALADTFDFSGITLTGISRIKMGDGADSVIGSSANDLILGEDGADTLNGGAGNDTLVGGTGNDLLQGGSGDDIYSFGVGSGQDIAQETGGGSDTVELGVGISSGGVTIVTSDNGNDIIIRINGTTDQLTLDNVTTGGAASVEFVKFNDGTVWDYQTLYSKITIGGTSGDDSLVGNDSANSLQGFAGNDTLAGMAGNDTLDGGTGNDLLVGDAGNDVYIFARGYGTDTILDWGQEKYWGHEDGGVDTIQLGANIAAADIEVIQLSASDLAIKIKGTTDQVILQGQINDTARRIENVVFADGTVLTHTQLLALTLQGTDGDDNINAGATASSMSGGAGNDTLNGSAGADTLNGGAGNDSLVGNAGNDTYIFGRGSGTDTILDWGQEKYWGHEDGGIDTIQLGANITTADVEVAQLSASDLVIKIKGTTDQLILQGQINDTARRIESVVFTDGTVWTYSQLLALTLQGTDGDDNINAGSVASSMSGGAGNDTLNGSGSNDTLNGGTGSDSLVGSAGNDTYIFGRGYGTDTILDWGEAKYWGHEDGGTDTIQLGANITTADIDVVQISASDLAIRIKGTTDQLTLQGQVNDTARRIESVVFSDGTVWTYQQLAAAAVILGTSGNDVVNGDSGANNLLGLAGNDTINGLDGNDRITGGAGNDTIDGGNGTDVAVFAGLQTSYSLSTSSGYIYVTDSDAVADGDDGTDRLVGVETAEFSGGVQSSLAPPIVLDLDGDGIQLTELVQSDTTFDWKGDGAGDQTGWVGGGDGFLVYDRNRDGQISSANELSFTADKAGAKSDLDGLSAFDTNGDGLFSAGDAKFAEFGVWQDLNGNGRTDAGELRSLAEAGVASIDLAGTAVDRTWGWGENVTINDGRFTRADGSTGGLADVALAYRSMIEPTASTLQAADQLAQAMASFGAPATGTSLSPNKLLASNELLLAAGH